ncbi:MAG: hypothetical protein A2X67_08180 [Ignavibacteria bacterium GWA2_55_11]|nr:MAG: hypothetical protein A2X67_08180 [Ignavibacteria bacterium GWA2_55_11]OGU46323.1 MAG: hypothetical protein A2X68_06750 [Ignavibacteria bacterium GWC2_56_12]
MDRYLVISPHTEADCKRAIVAIEAAGFITHFDWGCKGGEHCGWAIVEADSAKEAMLVVPSNSRQTARAVKLVKFSPAEVMAMHKP